MPFLPLIKTSDLDLYGLLEILPTATLAEIKSAYRKKALICHPDKNPENSDAAKIFIQLSEVYAILSDEQAKAVYDQALKARAALKAKTKDLESKRKKYKDEVERREIQARERIKQQHEEALQKEIERLKKEGSQKLVEEQSIMKEQIRREQAGQLAPPVTQTQPQVQNFSDIEAIMMANLTKAAAAESQSEF